MKKNTNFIGLFISLAVIAYVLVKLDWQAVYTSFRTIDLHWLIAAFGVYLFNYVLRTTRFRILISLDEIPFLQLFGVTNLYGMYQNLLPAKSGELSFPILLKSRLNVPLPTSTATLITARFFDFATVALFLPPVLVTYWDQIHPWVRMGALLFVGGVFLSGIGLIWIIRNPARTKKIQPINTRSHPIVIRIWNAFVQLIESMRAIDQRRGYWRLWLLTIAIWFCVLTYFYFILLSLGESLSYLHIMVISIIMVPMTLLPIQGFANLGTHEIGWAAAFTLFGYSKEAALNIAVSSHIIWLFFVLLLGALGLLLLRDKTGNNYA